MSAPATLARLRVLVTRPAAQAEPLCQLLAARGAEVVRLPLQAIEPARQPHLAQKLLQQERDAQAWIFTSVNAVRFARQLDAGVWPRCLAVGAATAAALTQLGAVTVTAAGSSSEALLALPELQDIAGRRYLIVSGEDGLDLLRSGLRARGALADKAAVYRRVDLPHAPAAVAQALRGVQAIVITSGEALERLLQLAPAAGRARLLRTQLVVPSQRVVELAQRLGFLLPPLRPESVADAAYVRCLEDWRAAGLPPSPEAVHDGQHEH